MDKQEKSLAEELADLTMKQIRSINSWIKPKPEDPIILQGLKLIFKSIVVLIFVALSPIMLVILVVAFFASF